MTLKNDSKYHYLNITETYLPPVSQKDSVKILNVKSSLENDFDVDATSAGVLSNFSTAGWCSLDSVSSNIYIYSLNTDVFTVRPFLRTGIISAGGLRDADANVRFLTDTTFEVRTFYDGLPTAHAHNITAKKRGADRSSRSTPVVNGKDVCMANHSNSEFDTGEVWIDGRTIYGRSFEVASDITTNIIIDTIDSGLEPVGHHNWNGNDWIIMDSTYQGTSNTTAWLYYDSVTGGIKTNVTTCKIGAGTKFTLKYVK